MEEEQHGASLLTRELFGTGHASNDEAAILKIQKLEARLSGRMMMMPNAMKNNANNGASLSASPTGHAAAARDFGGENERSFEQQMGGAAEREVLEDSEDDEDEDEDLNSKKLNKGGGGGAVFLSSGASSRENSRDSQRENRAPKESGVINNNTGGANGKQSASAGKKRKKGSNGGGSGGKGGFATVARHFSSSSERQQRANKNNDDSEEKATKQAKNNGLSSDGGMIAQLESATGVSGRVGSHQHLQQLQQQQQLRATSNAGAAATTSPRFDQQAQQGVYRMFGSGDGGKSRDGSDVPKEVFQPPLQRELFSSAGVSSSSAAQLQLQQQRQQHQEKIKLFEEKILALEQQVEEVTREREDAERQAEMIAKKLQSDEKQVEIRRRRARIAFAQLGKLERAEARRKLRDRSQRLGCVAVRRVGTQLSEVWEDGEAFAQLEERMKKIVEQKKDAEERRRAIKRKLPPPGASAETTAAAGSNNKDTSDKNSIKNNNNDKHISDVHREYALSEEVHKTRVNQLRREEEAISREREVLEREKLALAREIKRTRDEDDSRFNDFPMLGGQEPGCERYVLTNLLGRGGFSEVYRAWDCHEMKEVACKLHSLNPRWSEERKRAYVRHAARECSIHKSLKHDHVVKLLDVFEVDSDTFCTVLELCEGDDLDARLKNTGTMSEREARAIVAQIFAGLAYCHGDTKRVIHYDLKPGNILFDNSGRVKITDFGLSKVMESRENIGSNIDFTSVELTSQGAGTYWYLPPECFETGPAPPKISSKVDVWSVGVIFYQMVYGKRPFGHEQTQEQILQAGTIRDAKKVDFPQKPALSSEAKEFICKCLSYRQSERPDVMQAAMDPYLQFGGTNNGNGR